MVDPEKIKGGLIVLNMQDNKIQTKIHLVGLTISQLAMISAELRIAEQEVLKSIKIASRGR